MFWKKKKTETEIVASDPNNNRESFRYDFKDGKSFEIEFKGKNLMLINISAGGLAFFNQGFTPLDFGLISFSLDIPDYTGDTSFSAELRILKIDDNNVCHCIFENCSLEQHELLHKYVLEMQKNDLAH